MSECVTCKGRGRAFDGDGERVFRLSEGETCDECGRSYFSDKIKVSFTVVSEGGKEKPEYEMVDIGDTPMEAINTVLEKYSDPRGDRVKSIDRIEWDTENGYDTETRCYEETGVIVHEISLSVNG